MSPIRQALIRSPLKLMRPTPGRQKRTSPRCYTTAMAGKSCPLIPWLKWDNPLDTTCN